MVSPTSQTETEPGFMYHATNQENLRDIIQSGTLEVHEPSFGTEQETWPDGSEEPRSYWSKDASMVWSFAPGHGTPVVVRAKESSEFKKERWTGDYYRVTSVPSEELEVLTDKGWVALNNEIFEAEQEIEEAMDKWSGEWIRYTNHEQLFISKKPWHNDPAGIYFFPKEFETSGSWHLRHKYVMHARLKPGARVLDIEKVSVQERERIQNHFGAKGDPKNFWENIKQSFLRPDNYKEGWQVRWANGLRELGYDAIFDDTGTIHSSEVQLIVLNPRALEVTDLVQTGKPTDLIKTMSQIIKERFTGWSVEEENWRKKREYGKEVPVLSFKLKKENVVQDVKILHGEITGTDRFPTYAYAKIFASTEPDWDKTVSFEKGIDYQKPDYDKFKAEIDEYAKKVEAIVGTTESINSMKSMFYEVHYKDIYGPEFDVFRKKYAKNPWRKYVRFTNFSSGDTLEKKPHEDPDHKDPMGFYGYPIEYVIKHPADVWYGQKAKFLQVLLDRSKKKLQLQDLNQTEAENILQTMFGWSLLEVTAAWKAARKKYKDRIGTGKGSVGRTFMSVVQMDENDKVRSGPEQTRLFRKAGFDAVEDTAKTGKQAAINSREPEQIVFLTRDSFEIMETFNLAGKKQASGPGTSDDPDHLARKLASQISGAMGDILTSDTIDNRRGLFWTKDGKQIEISFKRPESYYVDKKIGEKKHKEVKTATPYFPIIQVETPIGKFKIRGYSDSQFSDIVKLAKDEYKKLQYNPENGEFYTKDLLIKKEKEARDKYHAQQIEKENQEYLEKFEKDTWEPLKTLADHYGISIEKPTENLDKIVLAKLAEKLSNRATIVGFNQAKEEFSKREAFQKLEPYWKVIEKAVENAKSDEAKKFRSFYWLLKDIGKVESVESMKSLFYEEPKLNKPMRGDVKKYKVYVKDPKTGNVKKVNFGDPNMEIKRDDTERRKAFRARHKCDQAKDKTTPKYWSCKFWGKTPVSKLMGEDFKYCNPLRPPHGFMPPWKSYEPEGTVTGERDRFCRHGVLTYDQPLTPEQIKKFELIPFGDEKRIQDAINEISSGEATPKYFEMMKNRPEIAKQIEELLKQKIADLGPWHPSELEQVWQGVKERMG